MLRRARMPECRLEELFLRRHLGLVRSSDENIKSPWGMILRLVDAIYVIPTAVLTGRFGISCVNEGGMSDVEVSVDRFPVEIRGSQCAKLPELASEIFVRIGS